MHTLTYNKILRDLEATSIYRKLPPKKPILLTSWTLCHYVYVFASLRIHVYCIMVCSCPKDSDSAKVYSIVFDILAPNSCREWFCSICPTKRIHTYIPLVGRCRRNWMRVETMGMPRRLTAGMAKSDFVWDTV